MKFINNITTYFQKPISRKIMGLKISNNRKCQWSLKAWAFLNNSLIPENLRNPKWEPVKLPIITHHNDYQSQMSSLNVSLMLNEAKKKTFPNAYHLVCYHYYLKFQCSAKALIILCHSTLLRGSHHPPFSTPWGAYQSAHSCRGNTSFLSAF